MLYSRFIPRISMLLDYKSRCPSMAPLLQPQRRKYLFGGIGLFVLILGIFLVVFIVTSGDKDSFVLDRTPLFAGRNNLPQHLSELVANNLSAVDLNSNLTDDPYFGRKNCPHCDTDFNKLRQGQVSSLIWVAQAGCNESTRVSDAVVQVDLVNRLIKKYPDYLQLVKKSEDLDDVFENKKLGSIVAIDGGQSLMNSTAFLRIFYDIGVRAVTLASEPCNGSIYDYIEQNQTLTEFGEHVVMEMNRLGMMIDIQGLSKETSNKILNMSTAPVMISHAAAKFIHDYPGNAPNETLEALKSNNGLMMMTFDAPNIADEHNCSISDVIRHINFIVDKIGFDNIAIGGNYDSSDPKPTGLEDVSEFPSIFKDLKKANSTKWTDENLDKLAGLNFKKFFCNVEKGRNTTKLIEE